MAQFDVHRNPGRRSRGAIPYVVILQSRIYDRFSTHRLVAPLYYAAALPEARSERWDGRLAPEFAVGGVSVLLNPLGITSVPAAELGDVETSLADDEAASAIVDALDRVFTRAFG